MIRGERRGVGPALLRAGLRVASWGFRGAVAARGALYGAGVLGRSRASVPVVSVGNLTAGGTGKTPLTIALAEWLVARGERVAVLARGYGARAPGELNDELELVRARVPGVLVLAGADRVASAARAAAEGATVLLLDDGFQHRRLVRDVDVLVIDALDPWGAGYLLPRGLLREPVAAARRASAVVISRVELVDEARVGAIAAELRRAGAQAPVATLRFEGRSLRALAAPLPAPGLAELRGKRALLLSGIGNPAAFAATVRSLGAEVVSSVALPDHHAFTLEDALDAARRAAELGADLVLVTEKDAVKLAPLLLSGTPARPVLALAIDARLERADELFSRIERSLAGPRPGAAPPTVSSTHASPPPAGPPPGLAPAAPSPTLQRGARWPRASQLPPAGVPT